MNYNEDNIVLFLMPSEEELLKEKKNVLARLRNHRIIVTDRMKQAFLNVPREEFVLKQYRDSAYIDRPLPILANQTISAIHMVMIYVAPSCTDPQVGEKILEIGAGSGYNAAMYAEMVAPKDAENPGHVYAVEIIPDLVDFARWTKNPQNYPNIYCSSENSLPEMIKIIYEVMPILIIVDSVNEIEEFVNIVGDRIVVIVLHD